MRARKARCRARHVTSVGARADNPAYMEDEILFEDFFVRGKFRIVEKVNNTQRARDAYRTFKAE